MTEEGGGGGPPKKDPRNLVPFIPAAEIIKTTMTRETQKFIIDLTRHYLEEYRYTGWVANTIRDRLNIQTYSKGWYVFAGYYFYPCVSGLKGSILWMKIGEVFFLFFKLDPRMF
uniref:Dynein light chain n=1 Tax=Cacopsylla melanoneura TaxID=428564 RepID=A0A8D8ZB21_9HEMI